MNPLATSCLCCSSSNASSSARDSNDDLVGDADGLCGEEADAALFFARWGEFTEYMADGNEGGACGLPRDAAASLLMGASRSSRRPMWPLTSEFAAKYLAPGGWRWSRKGSRCPPVKLALPWEPVDESRVNVSIGSAWLLPAESRSDRARDEEMFGEWLEMIGDKLTDGAPEVSTKRLSGVGDRAASSRAPSCELLPDIDGSLTDHPISLLCTKASAAEPSGAATGAPATLSSQRPGK
mmetsp:Transcript_17620/g.53315  ORF Transcript_17620/g.53315 Transcript_17620/m.53315 type:complete len:238 (-) Transcript_17620:1901-2614(-)|eukprot:scaffold5074_cov34-Tisochrysis_lutea.AAC.2